MASRRQKESHLSKFFLVISIGVMLLTGPPGCQHYRATGSAEMATESVTPVYASDPDVRGAAAPAVAPDEVAPAQAAGQPLDLPALIEIALAQHPELALAQAQVDAASGEAVQAGLYPNPRIGWMGEEMGMRHGAAGRQGPIVEQEIVTGGKLRLAQTAASYAVLAAQANLITRRFALITQVRHAYYDYLSARRERETAEELVRIAEEAVRVTRIKLAAGGGSDLDVVRAELELNLNRTRLVAAGEREQAARRQLAIAIGDPESVLPAIQGDLEAPGPVYDLKQVGPLVRSRSAQLQAIRYLFAQAEVNLALARALVIPNPSIMVSPFYSFGEEQAMGTVQVSLPLPLFNRNQGLIQTRTAELARAHKELRLVELQLDERLNAAYRVYQEAAQQVELYRKEVLPRADRALKLVQTGYQQGLAGFDYTTVLQAQQVLAQTRLEYIRILNAYWRAVSDIQQLLQE
ncbi:MAG: hypothetical protein C4296_04225 [Gemmataceae bacterium]